MILGLGPRGCGGPHATPLAEFAATYLQNRRGCTDLSSDDLPESHYPDFFSLGDSMHRRIASICAGSALLAASALAATGAAAAPAALAGAGPMPLARMIRGASFATPPTTAQCQKQLGIACYAPFQYHKAYNLAPLYKKG